MNGMLDDRELFKLASEVGAFLLSPARLLVTAESCTGGWIGKALTDVPGSSGWYKGGVVAYADATKRDILQVPAGILQVHGAVSDATAQAMAKGALEVLGGDIAVAVTGIAGPGGAMPGKPVGTVWFSWAWKNGQAVRSIARLKIFDGDREEVRRRTVAMALNGILEIH